MREPNGSDWIGIRLCYETFDCKIHSKMYSMYMAFRYRRRRLVDHDIISTMQWIQDQYICFVSLSEQAQLYQTIIGSRRAIVYLSPSWKSPLFHIVK